MNTNLDIDKRLFEKYLLEEQTKFENEKNIQTQKNNENCLRLKKDLETSLNYMFNNNIRENSFNFRQNLDVKCSLKDCGFLKDISSLNNIVKEKSPFKLSISEKYSGCYYIQEQFESTIKILFEPK